MAWVKLDDRFFTNPKTVRAGRDARDLYLAALCYCAGELTNGYIPTEALPQLIVTVDVTLLQKCNECVTRLIDVGLWEVADGGWHIHDYLDWNPSADQVKQDRAATRRRVQEWREKKRAGNAPGNAVSNGTCNAVSNAVSNGDVTVPPYPYPSIYPSIPKGIEAPDAKAPGVLPEPVAHVAKRREPKRRTVAAEAASTPEPWQEQLFAAFEAAGLPPPELSGGEGAAAKRIIANQCTAGELAACWAAIAAGEYGQDFDQRNLSFVYLSGSRRAANWVLAKARPARRVAQNGKPKNVVDLIGERLQALEGPPREDAEHGYSRNGHLAPEDQAHRGRGGGGLARLAVGSGDLFAPHGHSDRGVSGP